MNIIKLYLLTVPVFFAIDLLWLGVLAKGLYQRELGHLLRPSPNWPVAILFYLLFIGGIIYFAVLPGLADKSLAKAAINGALFGFMAYMTYELTNYALIKDWPARLVPIDIAWGVVLTAGTAALSYAIGRWLGN